MEEVLLGLFNCNIKRFCGISLGLKNLRSNYEWEIEGRKLEIIKDNIMDYPNVKNLEIHSGNYTQENDIKISASISYDLDRIKDKVLVENEDSIDKIVYSPFSTERRELLIEIFDTLPLSIIKKLEQEKDLLKKFLQEKNPDIKHFEIDPKHNSLLYWNEIEKMKILKSIDLKNVDESVKDMLVKDIIFAIENKDFKNVNKNFNLKTKKQEEDVFDTSFLDLDINKDLDYIENDEIRYEGIADLIKEKDFK